jgi:hypothetical protein
MEDIVRVRTAIFTGAAAVGALIVPMLAAAPAGASGPPWPDGTVFIASTGMRTGSGLLSVMDPAGGQRNLDHVSVQDVALASDGSVYYVSCNGGGLYRYSPATGGVYALSYRVGSCPHALAIQPNGDLLVSSFSGRYEVAPDGSPVGSDPSAPQDGSLAVDSDGDVYTSSGSQELTVTPVGGSTVAIQGLFDGAGINAVRLDGSGDLVASSPNGKAYVQPPTTARPAAEYDTGYYADGVAIDGAGNVYVSALAHSNQNGDQVDVFAPGAGSPRCWPGTSTRRKVWPPTRRRRRRRGRPPASC